jgi:hypothetical protein
MSKMLHFDNMVISTLAKSAYYIGHILLSVAIYQRLSQIWVFVKCGTSGLPDIRSRNINLAKIRQNLCGILLEGRSSFFAAWK